MAIDEIKLKAFILKWTDPNTRGKTYSTGTQTTDTTTHSSELNDIFS